MGFCERGNAKTVGALVQVRMSHPLLAAVMEPYLKLEHAVRAKALLRLQCVD